VLIWPVLLLKHSETPGVVVCAWDSDISAMDTPHPRKPTMRLRWMNERAKVRERVTWYRLPHGYPKGKPYGMINGYLTEGALP
jgi:hypothetical protein